MSRPIGTGSILNLSPEELDGTAPMVARGGSTTTSPFSHSPMTQSPGLTPTAAASNQASPLANPEAQPTLSLSPAPNSPLPPIPSCSGSSEQGLASSPQGKKDHSNDDGYHNQSDSSSEPLKHAPVFFPIIAPKASNNSRRKISASTYTRPVDPSDMPVESAREEEVAENALTSPNDDDCTQSNYTNNTNSQNNPDSLVYQYRVSNSDNYDSFQRELQAKLLQQILSHSQLQRQHLLASSQPPSPEQPSSSLNQDAASVTMPHRRISSPVDNNKVSRVTQPPRRLRGVIFALSVLLLLLLVVVAAAVLAVLVLVVVVVVVVVFLFSLSLFLFLSPHLHVYL
jgi:hypothetical protein